MYAWSNGLKTERLADELGKLYPDEEVRQNFKDAVEMRSPTAQPKDDPPPAF